MQMNVNPPVIPAQAGIQARGWTPVFAGVTHRALRAIVTPLLLAPDGADGFTIIAGERRYRAAKVAKLRQVPAQVREADGEALTLAVEQLRIARAAVHGVVLNDVDLKRDASYDAAFSYYGRDNAYHDAPRG